MIDAAELHAIGVLARRSGWRVILTVGLAHYEPKSAAREVAAAHSLFKKPGTVTTPGITAIGAVTSGKVAVEGKVRVVEIRPVERNSVLAVEINDSTGNLTAMFYGRTHIPGFEPGVRLRLDGKVSIRSGGPAMINPAYELLAKDG